MERLASPFGRICIVELDPGAAATRATDLHPDESTRADAAPEPRRLELIAGRLALRGALQDLTGVAFAAACAAILSDDHGAPILPAGFTGSIAHKRARGESSLCAAAIAAATEPGADAHVGIDLELAAPPKTDVSHRVLTERERAPLAALHVATLSGDDFGRAVALRFAIKEAIYKAIAPIVHRYVGFHEVEVSPADDGSCTVELVAPTRLPAIAITARWQRHDQFYLATARAVAGGSRAISSA